MNVYEKLNEARERFHKLKLKKTGHNKFAGYDYFELGDFLIPAMGVFKEVGLCAVVSFEKDIARMQIVDIKPDLASGYPASITITSPMGSAALKGCHEVQNIGAVETYQRRYLWVAALEIVEHDALDATSGKDAPKPTKITPAAAILEDAAISDERKDQLDKLAVRVSENFLAFGPQSAYEVIAEEGLDDMEKIYLSTKLDSSVRNPIKAYSQQLKKAA